MLGWAGIRIGWRIEHSADNKKNAPERANPVATEIKVFRSCPVIATVLLQRSLFGGHTLGSLGNSLAAADGPTSRTFPTL